MNSETRVSEMADVTVELLSAREPVQAFLLRDRRYAAYALGTLETEGWASLAILLARRGGEAAAVYLLAQPPEAATTLFLMGDPAAVEAIFRHPGAGAAFAWIGANEEHLDCLKRYWRLEEPELMLRMVVDRGSFRAAGPALWADLRRLGPANHSALAEAYDTAFGTPGAARLIARGPYYGVWNRGRLVSVAGTHIVAPRAGVAVVGNVWTRPGHRERGLAKLVVSAVTEELLTDYEDIALNVREDNLTARRVYERLGYQTHCRFWQVRGRWRS